MSDASVLVTRAFRRLQAIDINEQPSATEMAHALDVMGEVMNGWDAQGISTGTFSVTGDTVSGSDTIKGVSDVSKVMIGLNVSGTGIPADTRVKAVLSNTRFQLDDDATVGGGGVALTFDFLPMPEKYEGALVALLAVRLSEDLGLPVSAKLATDAADGWTTMLAGYIPDRKIRYDRALAVPAGYWDATTDVAS